MAASKVKPVQSGNPDISADAFSIDKTRLIDFLENALDRDWFHLYFISADDSRARPQGFVARSPDEAARIIERENADGRGCYFGLNTPSHRQRKKALKQELEWLFGLHVDIDLPKTMKRNNPTAEAALDTILDAVANRLPPELPAAPMIVFTGNGVQLCWFFQRPIRADEESIAAVETVNKRIVASLKKLLPADIATVDSTHNAERILRVPETVNWPSAKKKARGCTPVRAELIAMPGGAVEMADFDRLPKVAKVDYRASPDYRDYCLESYSEGFEPWTAADFLADLPDLNARVQATLDAHGEDRSPALWRVIMDVCDFVERKEGVGPAELRGSLDLLKCVSHIVWDLGERCTAVADALTHYDDHYYQRGKLGYDLVRTLEGRMDEKLCGGSVRAEAAAERRLAVHEANVAPEEQISVEAATLAFLEHVKHALSRKDLPSATMSGEGAAYVQGATRANIRAILSAAAITPRWDVMREQVRFTIDPVVGTSGGAPTRPAFHFARACARYGEGDRGRAELALIIDAIFAFGIRERGLVAEHIEELAREHQFHPLEDLCTRLPWDGRDRYAEVAACLDTTHELAVPYMRTFFRSTIGAIKSFRRFHFAQDGLELSASVVLIGPQGVGKSTFWRMVAPPGLLASGTRLQIGTHGEADSMKKCLSGVVCVLNELGATHRRSEADALKEFLSSTVDNYRTAYGRVAVIKPRMTVFCGTANPDFALRDVTGDRRWLCLQVNHIDRVRLADIDLQQVYAQAWHEVIDAGEKWWLDAEEEAIRNRENARYRDEGEEAQGLRDYMTHVPAGAEQQWLTANQICRLLKVRYSHFTWQHIKRVLDEFDVTHQEMVRRKNGPPLRRVWSLPVLPERYRNLLAGG